MPAFWRVAMFLGAASALFAQSTPMSCVASALNPPLLRIESITEPVADIVVTCTGGQILPAGSLIPTTDITVSMGQLLTSRILNTTDNLSEILLLIDEPGSYLAAPVPGYGPAAHQTPCFSVQGADPGGCVQYAQVLNGIPVPSSLPNTLTLPPANIFFGSIKDAQVTFHGVPLLPPGPGAFRIFRVTNLRVNAAALGGGGFSGTTALALVSLGGPFTVSNPVQTLGYLGNGAINVSVIPPSNNPSRRHRDFGKCEESLNPVAAGVLRFTERFPRLFKVRGTPDQSVPGADYRTESGLTLTAFGLHAGLADFGTRLRAVFQHVPAGVRLFVSPTNIATTPSAVLVPSETIVFNGAPPVPTGTSPVELPVQDGTATAVWEVIKADPDLIESLSFGVWQQLADNSAAGTITVAMNYAPVFNESSAGSASASLPVGRFADLSFLPRKLVTVNPCGTRR